MTHEVRHNPERSRYEIYVGEEMAGVAEYRADGSVLTFPHTVIRADRRGQGLGAELVQAALDDVRRRGATVVPRCRYVARWLDRHPAYGDLVAPDR